MRVCVIGGANADIIATSFKAFVPGDSNPGTVRLTAGGVGRNIAHNLAFDMAFLKVAFPAFARNVSNHGRDSMRLAITLNDLARMQDGEVRFTSVSLQSLKLALDIEGEVQHHALEDAKDAAHVYRKLISMLRMA